MKRMIALCLACAAMPAWSGIYIYGTRIIYPAQKKDITVQLMNDGKRSSLIQAWIDNGDTSLPPEKLQVPFIMTPPVIRVAANSGQQLKIKNSLITCLAIVKVFSISMYWIFHQIQTRTKIKTSLNLRYKTG